MSSPKVKFINIPLKLEANWLYHFLFEDKWGWEKIVIKKHPKLKQVYDFKSRGERIKFIKKYLHRIYNYV